MGESPRFPRDDLHSFKHKHCISGVPGPFARLSPQRSTYTTKGDLAAALFFFDAAFVLFP